MSKKFAVLLGFVGSALVYTQAQANPASTEYVRSAISQLETKTETQFRELTKKIKEITDAVNQSEHPVLHRVGEVFQGGMIFYLDDTRQHGLVVSLTDLGEPIQWRNGEGGDRVTNAQGQGLGSGETNTRLVIAEQTIDQQDGDFAALRTSNYAVMTDGKTLCSSSLAATQLCYGGWYLPSVYELVLLHNSLKSLPQAELKETTYWSSTELNATQALAVDFFNGEPKVQEKFVAGTIRAIHSF